MQLQHVSSHFTDIFDEGAAESVAYDPASAKIFFTNTDKNTLGILDISDPMAISLEMEIDLSPYGGGANSVDVANGLVAVAVENNNEQAPGQVVFFDTDGAFINDVEVGALPDMLTFTNDGTKVLVANEGKPDGDYQVDPEGTVSIIDISGGAEATTVQTVTFRAYNDSKASLQNKGVRIFGPNATVAQDLEPEYISVTPDDALAYVTLQENNALAVIHINSAQLLDLLPMGVKDHQSGAPQLRETLLNKVPGWPDLGRPLFDGGQPVIKLGGFSGLYFDPAESDDNSYVFYTIPDHGPALDAIPKENVVGFGTDIAPPENLRPFLLPTYQARIIKLRMDKMSGAVTLEDSIMLRRYNPETLDTVLISGRSAGLDIDELPVTFQDTATQYTASDWVDTVNNVIYTEIPTDAFGGDMEGIVRDRDGNFWLCDEYRPSVYKIAPNGVLIQRYVPDGATDQGDFSFFLPKGLFGLEIFPEVYNRCRDNRGFEAIAYDPEDHVVYTFLHSPLFNPDPSTQNNSDVIRILGINAGNGTPVSEYVYLLERNRLPGYAVSQVDKISDAVYTGNGRFLVLERDSSTPGDGNFGKKYVYEISLKGATNILGTPLAEKMNSTGPGDKTLEMMTPEDLASAGIVPAHKTKVLNLPSIGYLPNDKPEGLAQLPDGSIAVINDNDFGAAAGGLTDDMSLGIITFQDNYGFDGSDQDGGINVRLQPTLGMFQPDAIASFAVNGHNYLITANEGNPRVYEGTPGFTERTDVADIFLDPEEFENVDDLQREARLGRLAVTDVQGDLNQDGLFDRLYSFGGRSFSILDEFGNLVYDSGNALEEITAQAFPNNFNAGNADNNFESRSDDRGPEPGAVAIGEVGGNRLAFIGLKGIGGILVFRIDDPSAPQFLQYLNNRNFGAPVESREAGDLGVEDIVFIPAEDSPVNLPLLVTANEVSGTVSIFSFGELSTDVETITGGASPWRIYPNPVGEILLTNIVSDYGVFSLTGKLLRQAGNTHRIELPDLPAGTYLLRDLEGNRSKLFVKQ
jgi:DNA-binding beta-propeller fold protein YncE